MLPNDSPLVPLSYSEWLVLICLYDLGSANPIEVSEELNRKDVPQGPERQRAEPPRSWRSKECGTLLARLARKGYVSVDIEPQPGRGRPLHKHTPLISRQTVLRWQFQKFVRDHQLTEEEFVELLPSLLERRTALALS